MQAHSVREILPPESQEPLGFNNVSAPPQHIAIIGAGFSGIKILKDLAGSTASGVRISLIEKDMGRLAGGLAYSPSTAQSWHETNIPARMLSADSDSPDDFVRWYSNKTGRNAGAIRDKIVPRHMVNEYMSDLKTKALNTLTAKGCRVDLIEGEATDIEDKGSFVTITLRSGEKLDCSMALLATGNFDSKRLPCVTEEKLRDWNFASRYMTSQWDRNEQELELGRLKANANVLIIGTAMSAYDAARSLLRQGHKGSITMISRGGYEHFSYPKKHEYDGIALPRPAFLSEKTDAGLLQMALREFRALTGIAINPFSGDLNYDRKEVFQNKYYTSEQVLRAWEKYLPDLAEKIGTDRLSKLMQRHASLINTLRVGAGHGVCEDVRKAKARGQIEIINGSVADLSFDIKQNAMVATIRDKGTTSEEKRSFDYVVSSLGPNHDYTKTKNSLWRNIFERGYTSAHELGVGIKAEKDGALPGCKRIFAVGPALAGQRMLEDKMIGPVAFSIPGMRESVERTAVQIASIIRAPQR